MTFNWQQYRKYETILLSVLLYAIVLLYTYQYFLIANQYKPWTTDEFFYYIEARGVAADNIYQTPASLDGNTSFIGDFGFHGISYAIKDGFLAKLFFHTNDPPLLLINYLTCIGLLSLILLFKHFSLNVRLKVALIVATHYVLYAYTLSYMQETIHYFFAIIALELLYLLYQSPLNSSNKYLLYYLSLIIVAITFRYGWFMWALGLLPLATDLKSFIKWGFVSFVIMVFAVLMSRYIAAPYPYNEIVADQIFLGNEFSILNSLQIIWNRFTHNCELFFSPAESLTTTGMRYLLVLLLFASIWYSTKKRNRFTIACTVIAWGYFIAALAFYHVYWAYDERALGVLTPILAFSLVGINNSFVFYIVLAVQLFFLPTVMKETSIRNQNAISVNTITPEKVSREASYAKLKELITDDKNVVVAVSLRFVIHGTTDYFIHFPLATSKGYSIHYRMFLEGKDIRGTHRPDYVMTTESAPPSESHTLIYSDSNMYLYKLFY